VPKLTVTLITRDEAAHVGAAIESAAWADEVVVVDSQSTDDTAAIARRAGARVEVRDWPGFIQQKNYAASVAANDWILSIDADERVSPELAAEIRGLLAGEPPAPGYRMARESHYLGRWIRTTDWYPDDQLRLYDRRRGRWTGRYVHESVSVDGPVGRLHGALRHYPYRDIAHHLRTIDRYTTLASRQLHEDRRTVSAPGVAARGLGAFVRNYVLRGGFRQGGIGLLVSALNSYYVFLKFAKLWELDHAGDRAAASDVQRPD